MPAAIDTVQSTLAPGHKVPRFVYNVNIEHERRSGRSGTFCRLAYSLAHQTRMRCTGYDPGDSAKLGPCLGAAFAHSQF